MGNDDDPYADLAKTDQVLHFFEYEASKVEGYINGEPSGFAEIMEQKRQQYYNMVNSIEVQDQRISFLVGELLRLRAEFREKRRRELLAEIAGIKLDIGDCKTKRFFKNKERKEVHVDLVPMIARVQTARLIAETHYETSESVVTTHTNEPVVMEQASYHTTTARRRGGANRGQRYSDEELSRILK